MRFLLAVTAALSLSACASSDVRMLDSRTAVIPDSGTNIASYSDLTPTVLRKAAQETVDRDFSYFFVFEASEAAQLMDTNSARLNAGAATCAGETGCRDSGSLAWAGRFDAGTDLLVRFLTTEEAAQYPRALNAREVLAAAE